MTVGEGKAVEAAKRPGGMPGASSDIDDEELLDMVAHMPMNTQTQDDVCLGKACEVDVLHRKRREVDDDDDDVDMLLDMLDEEMGNGAGMDHDGKELEKHYNSKNNTRSEFEEEDVDVAEKRLQEMVARVHDEHAPPFALPVGSEHTCKKEEMAFMEMKMETDLLKDRNMRPPQRDVINATEQYVMVTSPLDGERVYAPLYTCDQDNYLSKSLRQSKGKLLSTHIDELLASIEKDTFEKTLAESKKTTQHHLHHGHVSERARKRAKKEGVPGLWVDKYAPSGFMDLLSDEVINRDVVRWLKEWDYCVFGTEKQESGSSVCQDPYKRPQQKLIMLTGPPGLGKTTLAHVVARHCGYKPLEINASDDRSGPALISRVQTACEMTSVLGDKKPNCIIIDEIDGAVGGNEARSAISALVQLANAVPIKGVKSKQGSDGEEEEDAQELPAKIGHVRKKKSVKPLTRPIICICNDLYAPALRPLRDIAKIYHVRPPSAERLVERLLYVCAQEGLKTEKSSLRALADRAECDIRSCLNTLQFISKKQSVVRLSDVSSIGVGQKDITVGAYRLWKDLLHRKKSLATFGKRGESDAQRCHRLYNTVVDFGDQDLILGGLYESLPCMILFDMALLKSSTILSEMQFFDSLQTFVSKRGDFSLMKYLPTAVLRVASLLSGPEKRSITWPRLLYSMKRDLRENMALVNSWMSSMHPETYTTLPKRSAVTDLVPLLPWLTSPYLRPVSRHLYSKEEKANLSRLVKALLQLGLTFSMEEPAHSDGSPRMEEEEGIQFIPPIHRLCSFPSKQPLSKVMKPRHVPIPTRQMVVHELDMEKIKHGAVSRSTDAFPTQVQQSQPAKQGHVPLSLKQRLEENKKRTGKKSTETTQVKRSWLDNLKVREMKKGPNNRRNGIRAEDMPILYKYHEGYTNAVKKSIKMIELLSA